MLAEYIFEKDNTVDWDIIRTSQGAESVLLELADQKMFAWDVETSGLDIWGDSRVIGHSFAFRRSNGQIRAFYMPCRHRSMGMDLFENLTQWDPVILSKALKPVIEGPALKVGHNLRFDIHISRYDDIFVQGPVHDTQTGARLINENLRKYALDAVLAEFNIPHQVGWKKMIRSDINRAAKFMGVMPTELTKKYGYAYVSVDCLGCYACQDAVYEYRLGEMQMHYLQRWPSIWAMEMDLFWVCLDMERVGVPIDSSVLFELEKEQMAIMGDLAPRIYELAGEEFEITNDNQVRYILFDKLGYPTQGTTKGSKEDKATYRVDDDVLWTLAEKENKPIAKLIRQYNDAEKIVSTYTRAIIERADRYKILHSEIDPGGAKTGRVSSKNPNLQNIPIRTELGRRVRKAFVTRPGMFRYCIDFSQLELRMLAHLSQDPILQRVYHRGLDAHSQTAFEVFGTDQKVDGIDMRRIAKILNFGISFGMTEIGLMRNVNKGLPPGQEPITEVKARFFLDSFYQKYKGIDQYRQSLWRQVAMNNGSFLNIFGRPRRIPAINDSRGYVRRASQRQAISTMVQGTAADLVKYVMVAVYKYLKEQSICEAYMVLMIHDDLQFDLVPDGSARLVRDIVYLMENTCQQMISVPIKVDVEYFLDNWANKKSLAL